VWIVNYYHIKPGQGDAFWKDFRENSKPVHESLTPAARPEYGPFARQLTPGRPGTQPVQKETLNA
jgi:hypothetical protein